MSDDFGKGPDGPGELDMLAAEFALGLLSQREHDEAARRLAHDSAFAAEASRWENRFAAFAEDVAPVEPPDRVWRAIEARAAAEARPAAAEARRGLWHSLPLWRGVAFTSLAAAAASLVAVAILAQPPEQPMVAALAPGEGLTFVVALHRSEGMLVTTPVALSQEQAMVPELWFVPEGDTPHSLGVLDTSGRTRHSMPEPTLTMLEATGMLAISMEPPGGSPTGQPTGPIVASGRLMPP